MERLDERANYESVLFKSSVLHAGTRAGDRQSRSTNCRGRSDIHQPVLEPIFEHCHIDHRPRQLFHHSCNHPSAAVYCYFWICHRRYVFLLTPHSAHSQNSMPYFYLLYAVYTLSKFNTVRVGTVATYKIGKKLIRLNYEKLQREADFRYSLVRVSTMQDIGFCIYI